MNRKLYRWIAYCCVLFLYFSLVSFINPLAGLKPKRESLVTFGGGYLDGGDHHSGGVAQLEYRWYTYFFDCIRPQASLVLPELKGAFLGVGVGLECYLSEHFILIPSFEPGLYYRGKARNLGYPIEFRSCLELAYETSNRMRLGFQIFHISNASLGRRNPGLNAFLLYLGFPVCL
jgi:lipid A 3-O-deacylase